MDGYGIVRDGSRLLHRSRPAAFLVVVANRRSACVSDAVRTQAHGVSQLRWLRTIVTPLPTLNIAVCIKAIHNRPKFATYTARLAIAPLCSRLWPEFGQTGAWVGQPCQASFLLGPQHLCQLGAGLGLQPAVPGQTAV